MTAEGVTPESRLGGTERALKGWLWMAFGATAQGAVTVSVVAVLARLLTPSDFGAVSAALLVVNLAIILAQALVGPALVQHPRLRDAHVHTALAVALAGGGALLVLLWVAAPAIEGWMDAPRVAAVVRVLACVLPLHAVGAVAEALLRRELQFRTVATIRVASYTFGYGLVGISVALLGGGLWALVAAHGSQAILNTGLLVMTRRGGWRLRVHRGPLRDFVTFAGGFLLGRMGNYSAVNGDNFVVVKVLGVTALGFYERAYQLMAMPAVFLGQVMDDVLFPAMAQIQGERARLAVAFRRCLGAVALATLPFSAVVVVLAPEIVAVALGPRWGAVVTPFRILALGTLFRSSYKISDSLARALGAVYRRAWRQWMYAALVVGGGLVGQRWGLPGVAMAVLVALGANFFLSAHLSIRLLAMPWSTFLLAHGPGLKAAAVVGPAGFLVAAGLRQLGLGPVEVLLGTVGGVGLLATLLLTRARAFVLGSDGEWLAERVQRLWLARFVRLVSRRAPATS